MTADTQAPAPAPTADMVLVPREPTPEMKEAWFQACDVPVWEWADSYRAMLAASPTPSPGPADAHRALGHLYGIASSIASVGPDIASDIRHHANTIMWAMTSPSPVPVGRLVSVNQYARDYYIAADGGDYTPLEGERAMIEDAIEGYLAQVEEAARIQSCVTTPLAGEAGAVEALRELLDYVKSLNLAEGYCMCGSEMDAHGIGSGHAPVDMGEYYAAQEIERAEVALAASLTPPKAETETTSERDQHQGETTPDPEKVREAAKTLRERHGGTGYDAEAAKRNAARSLGEKRAFWQAVYDHITERTVQHVV